MKDAKFGNTLVSRLVNTVMESGKKSIAQRIVYGAFEEIAGKNPALEIDFVQKGGHAGFITGSVPWRPFYYAEYRVGEFLAEQFARDH